MAGWYVVTVLALICLFAVTYLTWRAIRSRHPASRTDSKSDDLAGVSSKLVAVPELQPLADAFRLRRFDADRSSERITAFSIAIARSLDVSREQTTVIARGAFLRDIGMPSSFANKSSPPKPDETTTMLDHCRRGYEMLKVHPYLADAAEIVYAHEEWFDGTGYPRGLKGNDIPLGARIVSVAVALEALAFDDPHRRSQSVRAARKQIMRGSGRQFDPAVVNTFLGVPERIWEDLGRAG